MIAISTDVLSLEARMGAWRGFTPGLGIRVMCSGYPQPRALRHGGRYDVRNTRTVGWKMPVGIL